MPLNSVTIRAFLWMLSTLIPPNNICFNVSVPDVCVLTTSYEQTLTPVGVNGGALPCFRLACATSGDCLTKEPHLSPQHYELNAKRHVPDQTRVSVSRRYSKGKAANKLGGSHCADLTAPHRSVPSLLTDNEAPISTPKGGREGKNQIVTTLIYGELPSLNNRT